MIKFIKKLFKKKTTDIVPTKIIKTFDKDAEYIDLEEKHKDFFLIPNPKDLMQPNIGSKQNNLTIETVTESRSTLYFKSEVDISQKLLEYENKTEEDFVLDDSF